MYIGRNTVLGTWGQSQRESGEAINHRDPLGRTVNF